MNNKQQNGPNLNSQRPAGFNCPKCNFFIEVSIQSLLFDDTQKCPGCGIVFSMDRKRSTEALQLVQKLHVAMKNLDSVKKFNNAPK
jgi:transcription elongation factor Elf1